MVWTFHQNGRKETSKYNNELSTDRKKGERTSQSHMKERCNQANVLREADWNARRQRRQVTVVVEMFQ